MTFLPLVIAVLGASTSLPSSSDSTTPRVRPTTPPPVVATVATVTGVARDTSDAAAPARSLVAPATGFAAIEVPAPVAEPAAAPAAAIATAAVAPTVVRFDDGRVPMPAWAVGARMGLVRATHADSIVVEKSEHRMSLFAGGARVGTYLVAIGKGEMTAKVRMGDNRTPEGLYYIDRRNPNSRFHLALHVSYPNAADIARAKALGVATGGDIMIHGLPNGQGWVGGEHRSYDWTNGCVAVTDKEIEEIWRAVPVGTPIRILP